jgi:hypothetical protein
MKPHPLPDSESALGVELSRHIADHHIRDASAILLECLHQLPTMEQRMALTNFIGLLLVAEQRLRELDLGTK